jgi:hydrogenase maturation protease
VLVVGVGSPLRSDDGAGRHVAESLAGRLPAEELEVRTLHQLTPELADAMTDRALVAIVDASVEVDEVVVTEVVAVPGHGAMTHHLDVATLVTFAEHLGRPPSRVVTIAVPAFDLGLGTSLSARTAAAVDEAVEAVLARC